MTLSPIEGVYLSAELDLEEIYADLFHPHADKLRLRKPEDIDNPEDITFAVVWLPEDDAFTAYPNLKMACSIAAGVDAILACPSLPKEAIVTRTQDHDQADFMAGFAAWNVVWHHRNMETLLNQARAGVWERQSFEDIKLPQEYTVGVLGYGLMGKAVARAVAGMGYPVVAALRRQPADDAPNGIRFEVGEDAIGRTAAQSDCLINVLPLTPATENILNADLFNRMPKGSTLIQIGRGAQMVEDDLDAALDSGQLSGATLDVFREEPLPADHKWWRDTRILITPHQASESTKRMMTTQVIQSVLDMSAGKTPENAVDRTQGY